MALFLLAALIGVPLVEIAVFVKVGGLIGLWPTLALVVATAVIGTVLLRRQGLATLERARAALDRGELPVQEALDGVCLLIAGALLLTPGFVTDVAGAVLLVPAARHALQRWVVARLAASGRVHVDGFEVRTWPPRGPVIDGEFEDLDDEPPPRLGRP